MKDFIRKFIDRILETMPEAFCQYTPITPQDIEEYEKDELHELRKRGM